MDPTYIRAYLCRAEAYQKLNMVSILIPVPLERVPEGLAVLESSIPFKREEFCRELRLRCIFFLFAASRSCPGLHKGNTYET